MKIGEVTISCMFCPDGDVTVPAPEWATALREFVAIHGPHSPDPSFRSIKLGMLSYIAMAQPSWLLGES
jgi:hypothetical protein